MLTDMNPCIMTLLTFIFCLLWHLFILYLCVHKNESAFDCNRPMYRQREWENNGKWYVKYLKITKWKDLLPQHIAKDGFSKEHFTSTSIEYLDMFILETCRGEWNHIYNCVCALLTPVIFPAPYGIIFSIIVIVCNLPYIAIQRYNRIRLNRVRERILRKG